MISLESIKHLEEHQQRHNNDRLIKDQHDDHPDQKHGRRRRIAGQRFDRTVTDHCHNDRRPKNGRRNNQKKNRKIQRSPAL